MIIFLAFSVILVTLVLQGLTLPWVIRSLGLSGASETNPQEEDARRAIMQAALTHLEEVLRKNNPELAEVYDDLALHYRHRLATLSDTGDGPAPSSDSEFYKRFVEVSRELLSVERRTAVQLRNQRRISDEVLRTLERELDLSEARLPFS